MSRTACWPNCRIIPPSVAAGRACSPSAPFAFSGCHPELVGAELDGAEASRRRDVVFTANAPYVCRRRNCLPHVFVLRIHNAHWDRQTPSQSPKGICVCLHPSNVVTLSETFGVTWK